MRREEDGRKKKKIKRADRAEGKRKKLERSEKHFELS